MLTTILESLASFSLIVSFKLFRVAKRSAILLLVLLICASAALAQGRKYGLFVGINEYTFEGGRLYGAVNDASNLREAMVNRFKFKREDTTLLTDASATREAIISGIHNYESMARAGDLFVFTYSGHGTVFPDASSEEIDETKKISMDVELPEGHFTLPLGFYDSALVPVDADGNSAGRAWKNLILDDELYNLFSAFRRKGAHIVLISDSCHSGTVGKGGSEKSRIKFVSPLKALKMRSLDELSASKTPNQKKRGANQKGGDVKDSWGTYIILAGSKDNEFSLDVGRGTGEAGGLFTKTLLIVLESGGDQLTYSQLIARVQPQVRRQAREQGSEQTPQLDSRFGNPSARIFSAQPAVKRRARK